jgi:GT2 family glycosyltransferase/glycosyltransferase involved in cell wall biosynthesis
MSLKDLSIIIVNYNTRDLLRSCLASIGKSTGDLSMEVIVIDNQSSDNSVAMLRNEFAHVVIISNTENVGFARACNQGIQISSGRYLLLLNSDTELFPDTLAKALHFMDRERPDPRIGALGCKILNPDGSLQYSVGDFPTLYSTLRGMLRPPEKRKYLLSGYNAAHEVDWLTGAFFLIDRKTIQEVGFFNERYFMYYEEVDWCLRAKRLGWKSYYSPAFSVVHKTPLASKKEQINLKIAIEVRRSSLYYFRTNVGYASFLFLAGATLAVLCLKWMKSRIPFGTDPEQRANNRERTSILLSTVWRTVLALKNLHDITEQGGICAGKGGQPCMHPLHVLMITGSYPPMRCGVGDYTARLAESILNSNITVTVLTSFTAGLGEAEVRVLPQVKHWGVWRMFPLAAKIRSIRPDIAHIQYPTNGYGYKLGPQALILLLWLSGIKIVATIHEFRRVRFLRKLSLFPFLICSHSLVFMADEERVAIVKRLPWLKKKMETQSSVIPVNSNIPVLPKTMRADTDGFIVSFFGLFYPAKMIESVISAFQILNAEAHSRITFRFIGDLHPHHREYFASIRKLAEMYMPVEHLEWMIGMSPKEVARALSGSDVCLLPYPDGASLRRTTLMAALSLGVPVVTTKTGETPDLFKDRNNVLFADGPERMAEMVMLVMNDKDLAATLALNGREVSTLFSWDRIADHHVTMYNTIVRG